MSHHQIICTAFLLTPLVCLSSAQVQQTRQLAKTDESLAKAAASQPDPQFHLYLLIGQSNMAGRGSVDAESKAAHPRVLMFDNNREWVPATDPLHFDKAVAGVDPGLAFGKQMAEEDSKVLIGIIPCAVDRKEPRAAAHTPAS